MRAGDTLRKLRKERGVLIAAHRGTSGGNIIFNTIPAYENALRHKADIVELDGAMTTDGVFYAFHDGTEPLLLGSGRNIRTMNSSYVDELYLRNPSLTLTSEHPNRLEDVFNYLRGRCLINLDRCWLYWREILAFIKKMDMEDQIIIKSPVNEEYLAILEEESPGLAYMPIVRSVEEEEKVQKFRINYCMTELIFEDIKDPLVEDSYIRNLHERGLLAWGNVITLDEYHILSGGKDDNNAITQEPDDNWGWCVNKGFDVLQTDWPLLLREYLLSRRS
ncbi:MAG: glycerophosphodiester phosphodiesterase family protein [Treponema sp.]|jgi:glycerophosphoryl diester phosphodiesterase|nr:glycerophosphodiester phosphodiesterase family protein [Treponema sp.]